MLAITALPTSVFVVVFGQTNPFQGVPFLSEAVHGSAIALMGWALWYMMAKERPRERKQFTETLDGLSARHERWEHQRHEDSEKLSDTLLKLSENCAEARAQILSRPNTTCKPKG
jgi:hypothetical protein